MKMLDEIGPLRVPVLASLVLAYLPVPALLPAAPGSSLLRGLFDLTALTPNTSGREWFLRTLLTFACAYLALAVALAAVHQCAAIIHDFAPRRLALPSASRGRAWGGFPRGLRLTALLIPALLAVGASLAASLDGANPPYLAVTLAATIALVLVGLLLRAVVRFGASYPLEEIGVVGALLDFLAPRFALRFATTGYGARAGGDGSDEALRRHVRAGALLVLGGIVLLAVGVWAYVPTLQSWIRVPALCSLYLLLMVATWALSGATFFFDYYRVPILTLLALPVLLVGGSSYVYVVRPGTGARVLTPDEIVHRRLGASPEGRVVVIAAAGGGIQAAAWTARVLEGLQDAATRRGLDARERFLRRIAALSGVSGGSVGIAPFVLTMLGPPASAPTSNVLGDGGPAFAAASASSLDPVVATWVTIDLLPFRIGLDRGAALQNAWRASWAGSGLPEPPSLASLAAAADNGTMPGLMFNSTSMTSGERVILGTTVPTTPRSHPESLFQAAVIAADRHAPRRPEYAATNLVPDLDLATAIRMSATFPLVSPAARCDDCSPESARAYLVDGGYVDNTGVQSAGEWVRQLLAGKATQALRVSFVQIVPFSEDAACNGGATPGLLDRLPPSQVAVPLTTLFNVRGPGQTRSAVSRLVDLHEIYGDRICVHSFVYAPCVDRHDFAPPLSWHLTVGEREMVESAWGDEDEAEARRLIDEVLDDRDCAPPSVAPSLFSATLP